MKLVTFAFGYWDFSFERVKCQASRVNWCCHYVKLHISLNNLIFEIKRFGSVHGAEKFSTFILEQQLPATSDAETAATSTTLRRDEQSSRWSAAAAATTAARFVQSGRGLSRSRGGTSAARRYGGQPPPCSASRSRGSSRSRCSSSSPPPRPFDSRGGGSIRPVESSLLIFTSSKL